MKSLIHLEKSICTRKIMAFIFALILLLTSAAGSLRGNPFVANAEELDPPMHDKGLLIFNSFGEETLRYIRAFSDGLFSSEDVSFARTIANPDGEDEYLYIEYADGYVIYNLRYEFVAEAGIGRLFFDEAANYIYNGPVECYAVDESTAKNLVTGEVVSVESITSIDLSSKMEMLPNQQDVIDNVSFLQLNNNAQALCPTPWVSYSIPYDAGNVCGPYAGAMWIRYMHNHHYTSYVPGNLLSSDGGNLADAIRDLIEASHPMQVVYINGCSPLQLRDGLNLYNYLAGVSYTFSYHTWSDTILFQQIAMQRPVIISTTSAAPDPLYQNHFVTGYGYGTTSNLTVVYVAVHDGYGNLNYFNPIYFDYMVYQNP